MQRRCADQQTSGSALSPACNASQLLAEKALSIFTRRPARRDLEEGNAMGRDPGGDVRPTRESSLLDRLVDDPVVHLEGRLGLGRRGRAHEPLLRGGDQRGLLVRLRGRFGGGRARASLSLVLKDADLGLERRRRRPGGRRTVAAALPPRRPRASSSSSSAPSLAAEPNFASPARAFAAPLCSGPSRASRGPPTWSSSRRPRGRSSPW